MRTIKRQMCKAIKQETPEAFEREYIEALTDVKSPSIYKDYKDGCFIAIITWETETLETETVADEFHLEGIRYVCGQCPYLEDDGDGRKKRFPCKYSEFSTVDKRQECCELFYKKLKQGLIEPGE